LDIGSSEIQDLSMLINYYEAQSGHEFDMYSPHSRSRYKFSKNAEFLTLTLTSKLITFVSGSAYKDMTYYSWT
jgi:hypothetical protein